MSKNWAKIARVKERSSAKKFLGINRVKLNVGFFWPTLASKTKFECLFCASIHDPCRFCLATTSVFWDHTHVIEILSNWNKLVNIYLMGYCSFCTDQSFGPWKRLPNKHTLPNKCTPWKNWQKSINGVPQIIMPLEYFVVQKLLYRSLIMWKSHIWWMHRPQNKLKINKSTCKLFSKCLECIPGFLFHMFVHLAPHILSIQVLHNLAQ